MRVHSSRLFLAAGLHRCNSLFDLLFKASENRFVLLPAIGTAAEEEGLCIAIW